MKKILTASFLLFISIQAMAARPFVTDDARLTTEESCQLESWTRIYPDRHELWTLPACNPSGNLEFTMGAGYQRDTQGPSAGTESYDYVFQLKTLFRPLKTNDWGFGLAAGTVRHPSISPGPNALGNRYAYLPLSISFNDDKLIVHTNLGWMKDKASARSNTTWGVGGEFMLTPRVIAIAETYGDDRRAVYQHLGGRFWVVPERVQIDATMGRQLNAPAAGRWFSLGLRLTPDHLF